MAAENDFTSTNDDEFNEMMDALIKYKYVNSGDETPTYCCLPSDITTIKGFAEELMGLKSMESLHLTHAEAYVTLLFFYYGVSKYSNKPADVNFIWFLESLEWPKTTITKLGNLLIQIAIGDCENDLFSRIRKNTMRLNQHEIDAWIRGEPITANKQYEDEQTQIMQGYTERSAIRKSKSKKTGIGPFRQAPEPVIARANAELRSYKESHPRPDIGGRRKSYRNRKSRRNRKTINRNFRNQRF